MRPFVRAPDEGLSVENPVGGILTFKATGDETGGALTAIETVAAPREGPPIHVHDEDELIYIIEGEFRVKLGDTMQEASPGSFVFIPSGSPHAWQNVSDEPGRFFAAVMPAAGGFERLFVAYAQLSVRERGVAAFARLAAETKAFRVAGPPLAESDPL